MHIQTCQIQGKTYSFIDDGATKRVVSPDYNSVFVRDSGFFARWGRNEADDPRWSAAGPEIMDLEIVTGSCPKIGGKNCAFCYKGNTVAEGHKMSFEKFKTIFDKMPPTLTQIAFGITGVQSNPDFIRMMRYSRDNGIIPNFTLTGADLTDEVAVTLAGLCGGLAVSAYDSDPDLCYDTVKRFTDLGVEQTNIHIMVSKESEAFVWRVLEARRSDPRLQKMNAIVFLGLKNKGRARNRFSPLGIDGYRKIIEWCLDNDIAFGFDSCSAPKFEAVVGGLDVDEEAKSRMIECSESCESSAFSIYIDVHGRAWPCSFSEDEEGCDPVDVVAAEDFYRDVWMAPEIQKFRNELLASECDGCRRCVVFPEINP